LDVIQEYPEFAVRHVCRFKIAVFPARFGQPSFAQAATPYERPGLSGSVSESPGVIIPKSRR